METPNTSPTEAAAPVPAAPPAPAIRVFGVGSAGLGVLDQLMRDGLSQPGVVAIHTDQAALAACAAPQKAHLENPRLRGLGTGGDPERGREAAEEQMSALAALCEGARAVVIITGLGGGAGTGISPVLAAAAKRAGARVLAFAILPFECEGNLRAQVAQFGLSRLRESADLVFCFPNQKTISQIDAATSLVDTFKTSNQLMAQAVAGAWRALSSDSVMGLPFTDLCDLIRQRSVASVFAVAEATGPNRVPEVLERLARHPLLAGEGVLAGTEAVAVTLLGGPALGMVEVNRVMERLHQLAGTAPVLMGAAISAQAGDTLLVGVLLALPCEEEHAEHSETPEPAAAALPAGPAEDLDSQLLTRASASRSASRFVPPPPALPPEKIEQLRRQQVGLGGRARKTPAKLRQGQLPLEIISKGRFEKSEPTIYKGEDLDVPTYIRRGVALN